MKPSLLIIGLGNPGPTYEGTRHNAGFWATDRLSEEFGEGDWAEKQKFMSHVQEARIVTVPVLLVKPQTYMNRSGEAVQKLVDFYKLDPAQQVLVIYDDIDLQLGELRQREKGSAGTHNGMKSIVDIFGENVQRLRIGLGSPAQGDLSAWVLSKPSAEERNALEAAIESIPELVKEYVMGEGA